MINRFDVDGETVETKRRAMLGSVVMCFLLFIGFTIIRLTIGDIRMTCNEIIANVQTQEISNKEEIIDNCNEYISIKYIGNLTSEQQDQLFEYIREYVNFSGITWNFSCCILLSKFEVFAMLFSLVSALFNVFSYFVCVTSFNALSRSHADYSYDDENKEDEDDENEEDEKENNVKSDTESEIPFVCSKKTNRFIVSVIEFEKSCEETLHNAVIKDKLKEIVLKATELRNYKDLDISDKVLYYFDELVGTVKKYDSTLDNIPDYKDVGETEKAVISLLDSYIDLLDNVMDTYKDGKKLIIESSAEGLRTAINVNCSSLR